MQGSNTVQKQLSHNRLDTHALETPRDQISISLEKCLLAYVSQGPWYVYHRL